LAGKKRHPLSAERRCDQAYSASRLYNIDVNGPEHAIIVANCASRDALSDPRRLHLAIA